MGCWIKVIQYGNRTTPTPTPTSTANSTARETEAATDPFVRPSNASLQITQSTGPANRTVPTIKVTWCAAAAAQLTPTPLTNARPEPSADQSKTNGNAIQ